MKEYKKNQNERDEVFEKRKQDAITNSIIKEEDETTVELEKGIEKVFTDTDAWTKKKEQENMEKVD